MAKITHAVLIVAIPILATALSPQIAFATDDTGLYGVAQVWHVEGAGRWDYITVDAQRKLLYIPLAKHTLVVDAKNGRVVADIPGQQGSHGVALVRSASADSSLTERAAVLSSLT